MPEIFTFIEEIRNNFTAIALLLPNIGVNCKSDSDCKQTRQILSQVFMFYLKKVEVSNETKQTLLRGNVTESKHEKFEFPLKNIKFKDTVC